MVTLNFHGLINYCDAHITDCAIYEIIITFIFVRAWKKFYYCVVPENIEGFLVWTPPPPHTQAHTPGFSSLASYFPKFWLLRAPVWIFFWKCTFFVMRDGYDGLHSLMQTLKTLLANSKVVCKSSHKFEFSQTFSCVCIRLCKHVRHFLFLK